MILVHGFSQETEALASHQRAATSRSTLAASSSRRPRSSASTSTRRSRTSSAKSGSTTRCVRPALARVRSLCLTLTPLRNNKPAVQARAAPRARQDPLTPRMCTRRVPAGAVAAVSSPERTIHPHRSPDHCPSFPTRRDRLCPSLSPPAPLSIPCSFAFLFPSFLLFLTRIIFYSPLALVLC